MVFSAATFVSRIVGLGREVATAAIFGATTQWSSFAIASQIPNLIRSLVADSALSAAFVPVFTELREADEEERAWRLAGTLISLILIVLGPITMLCALGAPQIVDLFVSPNTFTAAELTTTVTLTRILLPIVVLFALNGLIVGILNAHDHFTVPALAPIAWNFTILTSLLIAATLLPNSWGIYVYAVGTLTGTLIQVVLPMPWLKGRSGNLRLRLDWRDPRLLEVVVLMLPVTLSLGLINLQQLIDTWFSTHVPLAAMPHGVEGGAGPAILDKAFRIYMLPQGLFSVAVSTVYFPVLARHAARSDMAKFAQTLAEGLRGILLLLIPSTVFLVVFGRETVAVLYERGAFTADQTSAVAGATIGFAVGLLFNGASLLLIRAFFSVKQTWTPTIVSVLTLLVNIAADAALYQRYGIAGIAAATSLVNLVGFHVLYLLLRRRLGSIGSRRTLAVAAISLLTTGVAVGAGWLVQLAGQQLLGTGQLARIATMTATVVVVGAVYLTLAIKARIVDPRMARALRRRRGSDPTQQGE